MEGAHAVEGEAQEAPFRGQKFLLALSLLLLVVAWLLVRPYLGPVAFAVLIGFLLHPVYRWLKPRVKLAPVAAGIVLLLVAVALVAPLVIVGLALVDDVRDITERVSSREDVERLVEENLRGLGIPDGQATMLVERASGELAGAVNQVFVQSVTAATEATIALVVFFILLYFVLVDGERLLAYARRVVPLDATRRDRLLARTGERVKAILLGTLLVSVIQGVAAGVGWWLLGFPAPVFWGFVMTLLAVIPFLGPFVILIPAGLIAIAQGNTFGGVGLLIYGIVLVGVVDDLVRPYVIGRRSGVHPGIILVGILGGVAVFGVTGFVLGPLLLSLLAPVLEAWSRPDREPLRAPDDPHGPGADEDEDDDEDERPQGVRAGPGAG